MQKNGYRILIPRRWYTLTIKSVLICKRGRERDLCEDLRDRYRLQGVKCTQRKGWVEAVSATPIVRSSWALQILPNCKMISHESNQKLASEASAHIIRTLKELLDESRPPGLQSARWMLHALVTFNAAFQGKVKQIENLVEDNLKKSAHYRNRMKSSELPKNGNVLVQLFMTQKTTLAVSVSEVSKNSAFWNYPLPWKYGRVYVPVEKHYPAASYAKCKEILCHMDLNKDDLAGKRVVELGTVPGGWTMVLLEQGAEVNSVDWTDLKDPWFKVHSSLRHHTMDAKIFNPVSIGILDRSEALDYVFCDLALPPVKSVDLMEMWIQNRWAERVIWTFKMGFGHEVSHALTIRGIQKCLAKYEPEFVCTIRHLYKHENEVVVLGRWTDEMRARAESKKSRFLESVRRQKSAAESESSTGDDSAVSRYHQKVPSARPCKKRAWKERTDAREPGDQSSLLEEEGWVSMLWPFYREKHLNSRKEEAIASDRDESCRNKGGEALNAENDKTAQLCVDYKALAQKNDRNADDIGAAEEKLQEMELVITCLSRMKEQCLDWPIRTDLRDSVARSAEDLLKLLKNAKSHGEGAVEDRSTKGVDKTTEDEKKHGWVRKTQSDENYPKKDSILFKKRVDDPKCCHDFYKGCKWSAYAMSLAVCTEGNHLQVYRAGDFCKVSKFLPGEVIYDWTWYPSQCAESDAAFPMIVTTCQDLPIQLWDVVREKVHASYQAHNHLDELVAASSVCINGAGSKIISGYKDMIRIFDVNRPGRSCETRLTKLKNSCTQNETVLSVPGNISTISANAGSNSRFVCGSSKGKIGVYEEVQTRPCLVLQGPTNGITLVKFSPDGTCVFSGSRKDPRILGWDLRNPREPLFQVERRVEDNQKIQFDIDFSGSFLASGSQDGVVRIWDLKKTNGAEPTLIPSDMPVSPEPINDVAFHTKDSNIWAYTSGTRKTCFCKSQFVHGESWKSDLSDSSESTSSPLDGRGQLPDAARPYHLVVGRCWKQ